MPVLTLTSTDVPPCLRGPIAVSQLYLPRFWPTIYSDVFRASRKTSTLRRILRAIDKLYDYADGMVPRHDVDVLLATLDIPALKNLMAGFLTHLRTGVRQGAVGSEQVWRAAFEFVYEMLKRLGALVGGTKRFHSDLHDLKTLYGQLSPALPARPRHIRALGAVVVEDARAILTPDGDRNPFRGQANQVRNLLIFEMLLRLGLRRGELLALGIDSLHSEFDPLSQRTRYWLNIGDDHADEDNRHLKPSIKTDASWRSIPVPETLATQIQHYISGHRGRPRHPFLFTSNQGRELSVPAVSGIFAAITQALSAQARHSMTMRGVEQIRPHDLRHTAVVARLQMFRTAGASLEESVDRLRPYFGWAPGSKMPWLYGRAFFETHYNDIWEETFNDHLTALRALMGHTQ